MPLNKETKPIYRNVMGLLWFILGVFLDQSRFSSDNPFGYICFLSASTNFVRQSVIDGGEFFKPASMYTFHAWSFPVWYILSVVLSESRRISILGPSSSIYNCFSLLFIHSAFLSASLRFYILLQNHIASLTFGCWNVFEHISPASGRIFFHILELPVLSVLFSPVTLSL